MNKIIRILFVFSIVVGSLQAQSNKSLYVKPVNFEPSTYFGMSLGGNAYLGEGMSTYLADKGLGSCLGYSMNFIYGYQFTPFWGGRINVGPEHYSWPTKSGDTLSINALDVSLQATMNLSYLLNGYDEDRKMDLDLFVGAGAIYRYDAGGYDPSIYGRFSTGFLLNYKLADQVKIHFEAGVMLVGDAVNAYPLSGTDGTPFDIVPNLKVGLTFHIPTYSYQIRRARTRY